MFDLFPIKHDIPFMSYARTTTVISLVTFVLAVFFLFTRGLHLSVEFTGGTVLELAFEQPVKADDLRTELERAGIPDPTIVNLGTSRDVMIRVPVIPKLSSAQLSETIMSTLRQGGGQVEMRRVEFIGPQIGQELWSDGAWAIGFVCLGIMAYLAFRFEWRFSVAAVIANMHDVVIILGFFAFFQWEFSLTVLAAVLSVLGYSVNESVIVFDRIRENLRKMKSRSTAEIINNAITRTMSRTVITHGATQLVVTSMLFMGGEVLHYFALALTIGILFGIYSSVLVASPIVLWLGVSRADFVKGEGGDAPAERRPARKREVQPGE